jgi:hypothetical protein
MFLVSRLDRTQSLNHRNEEEDSLLGELCHRPGTTNTKHLDHVYQRNGDQRDLFCAATIQKDVRPTSGYFSFFTSLSSQVG